MIASFLSLRGMQPETIIRILTAASLAGLLLGVGLRLQLGEVTTSVRRSRMGLLLMVNFVVVPAMALAAVKLGGLERPVAMGVLLLAAAPFAPVVPVFARMARADLALAAGLSSLFPLLSAFLTPIVFQAALWGDPAAQEMKFHPLRIFLILVATIVIPLALGMGVRQAFPRLGALALRPVEMVAEFTGALSLGFVTFTEWSSILATGWGALLTMAVLGEASLVLGYFAGGSDRAAREVTGFGTLNRNIALALLVAIESFGTAVVSAVVADGLLLIFLGLLHVAAWRWRRSCERQ